ncbi:MAG TPA: DNA repair protein RecN [Sphingorhabdus sp.]|jgi:DNA repair protein RecN (Recombination protein N)|uniref:DNA repair protein RecN n=1 Tax=Sphingorhabdus sp. TaxID=1902408 RepID=UPI002CF8F62D|nr:DNA repair protein RecN [Sphingorhabdus sp.]HMT41184.1 DNA repair protein RecN [Sphingorhabdus sp.]HMU22890.1 DNA repair protein RecN [Sphingorhabdus sp.]
MLTGLSIRDVVLIEALDLEFEAGLGVLTGETGAGKSILLDALGLALGARADSGLVRSGADKAQVTASFDAPINVLKLLAENDIVIEAGEPVMVRRSVRADGGSKAFINDQPCSAALLRDAGVHLVEIHGQHDDRGLLNPRGHRALLDSFGRCDTALVSGHFEAWQEAKARLDSAREALNNAARDREWLEHAVAELRRFAPEEGEEELLATERADMQKGERIAEDLRAVLEAFEGSESGLAKLRSAARKLDRLAGEHALLAEALTALDRAVIEASEAEDKLIAATQALSFDPERLDAIEVRLFDLRGLARKHNVRPEELAKLTDELATKLDAIKAGGEGLTKLEAEVARHAEAYRKSASELSAQRTDAAKRLDASVAAELAPLKLDAAKFQTAVETLPEDRWTASGMDRVEFLISTNPGAPFAPLAKIASGGELSRFILSLKVALAEEGGAGTIIFDEIDRGVGGAVASAIGERLARLASGGKQLLAVTHSPQVAAKGQAHYFIAKSSEGTVTRTGVTRLDSEGRRQEIARMLSGAEVTDEARAQAARLMEGV